MCSRQRLRAASPFQTRVLMALLSSPLALGLVLCAGDGVERVPSGFVAVHELAFRSELVQPFLAESSAQQGRGLSPQFGDHR